MADELDTEEVLGFVAGQIYPANLPALLERARANAADDAVLDTLGRIPDHDYNGPTAVRRALLDLQESEH
jgi:hypothetical protein